MASSMKFLCVLGLILLVGTVVDGAGECGRSTPDNEAMKLAPCVGAAQDANAAVPGGCCAQIKRYTQNPKCLCAVLLSDTAKASGVQPEVALTIPKRCNFANRPSVTSAEHTHFHEVLRMEIHGLCDEALEVTTTP